MASKTNIMARRDQKAKERFYAVCGEEVRPVKRNGKKVWWCEKHDEYYRNWAWTAR